MSHQKILPYHLRFVAPTEKEIKEEDALLEHEMIRLLNRCAAEEERSLENLHEHLRIAMMLEFSTIPPYLCALYSIETGDPTQAEYRGNYGDNAEVAAIIRSVMMEEMLHFTLVGNILNAVSGEIRINESKYVPVYPTALPDSAGKFQVHLRKFEKSTIRTFLRIEQPTSPETKPKLDEFTTIGQFYDAIWALMDALEKEAQTQGDTIFKGDECLQIDPNFYYGGGGEVLLVRNLKEAKAAIDVILEQGEGSQTTIYDTDQSGFDQVRDLAHYFKFNEIYEEQRYADCQVDPKEPPQGTRMDIKYDRVYNMGINPKTKDFVSEDLKSLSIEFNLLYRGLLDSLQNAFTGNKEQLLQAVGQMYQLRYKAIELMRNPIPGKKINAGPTFEFLTDENIAVLEQKDFRLGF